MKPRTFTRKTGFVTGMRKLANSGTSKIKTYDCGACGDSGLVLSVIYDKASPHTDHAGRVVRFVKCSMCRPRPA